MSKNSSKRDYIFLKLYHAKNYSVNIWRKFQVFTVIRFQICARKQNRFSKKSFFFCFFMPKLFLIILDIFYFAHLLEPTRSCNCLSETILKVKYRHFFTIYRVYRPKRNTHTHQSKFNTFIRFAQNLKYTKYTLNQKTVWLNYCHFYIIIISIIFFYFFFV